MALNNCKIAVVGATGNVGAEILNILHERQVNPLCIFPVASERSAGKTIQYGNKTLTVLGIENFNFRTCSIALFSPGASISSIYAPKAAEQGCFVIDNTSYFRMHPDVPLVIPEINLKEIRKAHRRIIANPNCSTIQLAMVLKPIDDWIRIRRVVVATYQAVSGAGRDGVDELERQIKTKVGAKSTIPDHHFLPKVIAYNVIPQIDMLLEDGSTKEEWKMVVETEKILQRDIKMAVTCVRVPVLNGHSEAVNVELSEATSLEEIVRVLKNFPGVVVEAPLSPKYTTPVEVSGKDEIFVSRLRVDPSVENGIQMWVVADNLRKGAALNAIQIAEGLVEEGMVPAS